jgi:hypothetical protein
LRTAGAARGQASEHRQIVEFGEAIGADVKGAHRDCGSQIRNRRAASSAK